MRSPEGVSGETLRVPQLERIAPRDPHTGDPQQSREPPRRTQHGSLERRAAFDKADPATHRTRSSSVGEPSPDAHRRA